MSYQIYVFLVMHQKNENYVAKGNRFQVHPLPSWCPILEMNPKINKKGRRARGTGHPTNLRVTIEDALIWELTVRLG